MKKQPIEHTLYVYKTPCHLKHCIGLYLIKINVFLYVNISCHDNQSKTVTENSQKECMACKILKRINTF